MTVTTTVGLVLALPVVCWLATVLRLVPQGHRVVVTRRGVVRRVHGSGVTVRVPFLDQYRLEQSEPHELPLMVRTTTSDDVRVLVLAEATVLLPAPRPGTAYADPWEPAEAAAQEAVGRVIGARSAHDLLHPEPLEQRTLRHAVSAAVDAHGVTLLELDLASVDVQLDVPIEASGPR